MSEAKLSKRQIHEVEAVKRMLYISTLESFDNTSRRLYRAWVRLHNLLIRAGAYDKHENQS